MDNLISFAGLLLIWGLLFAGYRLSIKHYQETE